MTTLASFPFCSLWHIFIHIVLFIHVYMYVIESRADKMSLAVIWPTNIFKWHCNSRYFKKGAWGEREGQFCRFIVSFIRAFYPHPSMNIYYVYAYHYHICLTVYTSHTRQNYHLLVKYTTESVVEIIEKGIMYIPGTLYLYITWLYHIPLSMPMNWEPPYYLIICHVCNAIACVYSTLCGT